MDFFKNADREAEYLKNSTYGLSWWLIADDRVTLRKLEGYFSCYCESKLYKKEIKYSLTDLGQVKKLLLCEKYFTIKWKVSYIKQIINGATLLCNSVLKALILWVVEMASLPRVSEQSKYLYYYLFWTTAFNSIILMMVFNAQLDFIPIYGQQMKDGNYRDFTFSWYFDIGCLTILRIVFMIIGPFTNIIKHYAT